MAFELLPLKPEQHTISFVPRVSLELPFFNLTARRKKTPEVIRYEGRDEAGRPIRWEVFQNTSKEVGAPAVEAHEVWYLLVKPSIDASRKADGAIPEIIPLGGVRECLRKVGWTAGGHQARELIKALTQISFAGCVADLWVPTGEEDGDGKKKFLQIKGRFSRMSVYAIGEYHLTEEELAQNKFQFDLGDTIYIRLDPLEAKLQQLEDRRILDNQYLFSLSPAARRWYELMAGKIFGTVKNNATFCEINYSWYTKHHHTLKRFAEHKRVRFQMDRVIRDHLESGYLNKVEYRAVKKPDEEIDYTIRYYPGPGAKESNSRIQQFIRDRRMHRRTNAPALTSKQGTTPSTSAHSGSLALSPITSKHSDLASKLILNFGISGLKACDLVLKRTDAVSIQLKAWRFRDTTPRNPAGWLIQAIENDYALPAAYLDEKNRREQQKTREARQKAIDACPICDNTGYRHIKTPSDFHGIMRLCTHDPAIENWTPPDAQNSPTREDLSKYEKGLAEESTSP
jgi:hypothetical protein